MELLKVSELISHGLHAVARICSLLWIMLSGDYTNIYTDNIHNYTKHGISVYGKSSFVFRLKACSDGHIALISAWVSVVMTVM